MISCINKQIELEKFWSTRLFDGADEIRNWNTHIHVQLKLFFGCRRETMNGWFLDWIVASASGRRAGAGTWERLSLVILE